jgi:MerR family copper efflux transcriptional regulator
MALSSVSVVSNALLLRDVKRIAEAHIADLDRRIDEMTAMKRTLAQLASCCHGDGRPDCPILDGLADTAR